MEYWIYNEENEAVGILQEIFSVQWNPKYYESGSAEIHARNTDENRKNLVIGNTVVCQDRKEVMFIDYVFVDDTESGDITVSGYLNNLSDRVNISTIRMKRISDLLLVARNNLRSLNLAVPEFTGLDISIPATETTWGNVRETFEEYCQKYGMGFRVRFDSSNTIPYILELYYKGRNNNVIFSDELGNMIIQSYEKNMRDFYNFAYVAGEGEGTDRKIVIVDLSNGEDIKELYVDARDIQSTVEDAEEEIKIPDAEYEQMLRERGIEYLMQTESQDSFTVEIDTKNSIFEIGVDYDLGDIVKVVSTRYGIVKIFRIVGLNFSEEEEEKCTVELIEESEADRVWHKEHTH